MAERVTVMCDGTYRGRPCTEEPVARYVIITEGEGVEVDLCGKHAEPLLTIAALGRPVRSTTGGTRGRSRIRAVTPRIPPTR